MAAIGYNVYRVGVRRQQKPGQRTKSNFNYNQIVVIQCLKRIVKYKNKYTVEI